MGVSISMVFECMGEIAVSGRKVVTWVKVGVGVHGEEVEAGTEWMAKAKEALTKV